MITWVQARTSSRLQRDIVKALIFSVGGILIALKQKKP